MKNMACECGKVLRVADDAIAVTCYNCAMGEIHERHESYENLTPKRENKTSPEKVKKEKTPPKAPIEVNITNKTENKAKGTVDGISFVALYELGLDKKYHWKVQTDGVSRGQKIVIGKTLNKM